MSGTTLTAGQQVRHDVFFGFSSISGTIPGVGDFSYAGTLTSDGSTNAVSTGDETFLMIDTVAGVTAAPDLFVGTGFVAIENMNDLAPVIATSSDLTAGVLVYQGDSGGQTFYAGTGTEIAAFVGFGNTFATPATGGGTYEVSAGLAAADQLQTLATPASTADGNSIVIASGNANIAAGLGYNHIFLGTGTTTVANEGFDSILGGSGEAVIYGSGEATVLAGAGSTTYFGAGGTALIIGDTVANAGAVNVYGGSGEVTVYGGSGDEAAFGGTAGNNVLVSGSGNSTLVGAGNNDLLVASGAGTTSLVAGAGNETLFGGGATGTTNFFLGGGSDAVVAGTGSEYIQFGSGTSTVFGSTGADVYGLNASIGGSTDLIVGFNAPTDYLELQGFASSVTAASFFADNVTTVNGSTAISSPTTGDVIQLYGVTDLTAANFIVPSVSGVG